MAKKPKDKDQEEVLYSGGAIGSGPEGSQPLGTSQGGTLGYRIVGTGAYEISPEDNYYRASIYSEMAKINRPENTRQMILGQSGYDIYVYDNDNLKKKVYEYLPTFNNNEWLAFKAIQIFVDKATKRGETGGELSFTLPEFYEACGLSRSSNHQKEEALDALRGFMTRPKKIIYKFTDKKGKKSNDEIHILKTPLLIVIEDDTIKPGSEEEGEQIIDRELAEDNPSHDTPDRRLKKITVRPVDFFYKQLDTFHVKKSLTQYDELKALHPGGRALSHSLLLTDTLQTLSFSPYRPTREDLAYIIGLKSYIKHRRTTIINNRIKEALQEAKATGYLLSYHEDPIGYYVLYLNPEKCLKYADALEKQAKAKRKEKV